MAAKAALFCCKRLRRKALSPAGGLDGGVGGPLDEGDGYERKP